MANLESPVNLTCMLLGCGRKLWLDAFSATSIVPVCMGSSLTKDIQTPLLPSNWLQLFHRNAELRDIISPACPRICRPIGHPQHTSSLRSHPSQLPKPPQQTKFSALALLRAHPLPLNMTPEDNIWSKLIFAAWIRDVLLVLSQSRKKGK